ncbi:porin [Caballeronia sp. LjRoot34]|uniref:porin n=1 Tax=Caballeronia sp. LjRoot34 TaxID=3342325 RepID=UPI003ED102C1
MKKLLWIMAFAGIPMVASAQSSVTLYGVVGDGIKWVNNTKGGSTVKSTATRTPDRFGIVGAEDLGGGVTAIFRLENGFNVSNGAMTGNLLFYRAAYAGLDSKYGRLTLGRQFTALEDLSISLDPDGVAGADASTTPEALTVGNVFTGDTRFNNVIKYIYAFNGAKLDASYSPGGVAGNQRAGSNYAIQLSAQRGPLLGGIGYQRTYNADATQMAQNFQAGATLQLGQARLYLNYLELLISGSKKLPAERRDSIPQGGVVYQITPSLSLTAAFYYDIARNLGNINGAGGHKTTAYLIGDYFISKRTEVYVEVDRNSFSGAYKADPENVAAFNLNPGSQATLAASVGLVTHF